MSKVKQLPTFQQEPNRQFVEEVTRNAQEHAAAINELYDLRWDDLRFTAGAIPLNPIGAVAAPTVDSVETDYPATLLFSGSADNIIADVAQMPHAMRLGSSIKPHVHWLKKTASANVVVWEFFYRIIGNVGSAAGAWSSAITRLSNDATTTIGTQSAANTHLLTSFGEISMAGYTESALVAWRLYRRAASNASDTDTNAVSLISFDIHYQSDARGSTSKAIAVRPVVPGWNKSQAPATIGPKSTDQGQGTTDHRPRRRRALTVRLIPRQRKRIA